ncbi:PDZ domain-containing protein [Nonomuraea ferruginea]
MREGDIIVSVVSKQIPTIADLTETLTEYKPGDKVEIEFVRDGASQKVTVTLTELQAG